MTSEESFSIRQNELLYNDERIESKDYYVEISPRVVVSSGSAVDHSSVSTSKDDKFVEELKEEIDVEFWRGLLRNYADEEDVVTMLQNEQIRQSQQVMMETESHREKPELIKQKHQNGSWGKRQNVNKSDSSEIPSRNHINRDSPPLSPATRALTRSTSDKRFLPMYQEADEDADMNKVRHNIMLMIRNSATSYESFGDSDPDKEGSSNSSFDSEELSDTDTEHWNDNNNFEFHEDENILGFIRQSNKMSKQVSTKESTSISTLRVEQPREKRLFEHVIQKISECDDERTEKKVESSTDEEFKGTCVQVNEQDAGLVDHERKSLDNIRLEEYENSEYELPSPSHTHLEQYQPSKFEKSQEPSQQDNAPGLQHSKSESPKQGPAQNLSPYSGAKFRKHAQADLLDPPSEEMLKRYADYVTPHHHLQQQEQLPQENLAVRFANTKEANNDPEKMRLRYLVAKLQTEYRASKQREQKALDTSFIFSNLLHQHQKYAKSLQKKLALKEIEVRELRAMVDDLNRARKSKPNDTYK